MDSGSQAATVGDGAANFTAAHLWLDLLNASSTATRWDSSPPAEGTGLDQQQRLIREQAYRDFTTTIQVFILIGSLLGKSPHTNILSILDRKAPKPLKIPADIDRYRYIITQLKHSIASFFSMSLNSLTPKSGSREPYGNTLYVRKINNKINEESCNNKQDLVKVAQSSMPK